MQKQKSSIVLIALVVVMGCFLMGFEASVIWREIKFMESEFHFSKIQWSRAIVYVLLTATAVMMFARSLSNKYDRLIVLKNAALLYASSAILSASGPSFFILVFARKLAKFVRDFLF